ncbi:MAG TPA: hypothetical protein VF041_11620 [Gemmatimonadaceae bacterium]
MRISTKRIASGAAVAGGAGIATWVLARPRLERWGATNAEVAATLPGDARVPNAALVTTNAVTIRARPAEVWPWLAQMGWRRGGLYSYDWLDRLFGYLDRDSAEEVLPEFQHLQAGDTIPIGRGLSWPVLEVEPERALVLELVSGKVTWSFALVPVGERSTRLITRSRCASPESLRERLTYLAIEPPAFIMTRKMLLGIKRRAEALARRRERSA